MRWNQFCNSIFILRPKSKVTVKPKASEVEEQRNFSN